jgi:hypothetical protein
MMNEAFFGRKRETLEFLDQFSNSSNRPDAIQILGMVQSGRTSFLKHLSRIYSDPLYLEQVFEKSPNCLNQQIVMVYVDLYEVSTPIEFFRAIAGATQRSIKGLFAPLIEQSLPGMIREMVNNQKIKTVAEELAGQFVPSFPEKSVLVDDFDQWLRLLQERLQNAYFVYLLDDFDQLLDKAEFNLDFQRKMRALATKNALCWVLASRKDLLDLLAKDNPRTGSPFINILSKRICLSRLEPKDEGDIICKDASSRSVKLKQEDIETIRTLAGPWPRLMCRVTQQWIMYQNSGVSQDKLVEVIENYLLNSSEVVRVLFVSYWDMLSHDEKVYLLDQAHLNGAGGLPVPKTLLEFGVVETSSASHTEKITSLLFHKWIKKNKDYAR